MLQPGGIDAITEFWNWINAAAGAGGVGLYGDFNMTGSYDEWETARRLVERGERKLSDYGGELRGIEPPDEWKRYFDWQRQFRTGSASSGLAAPVEPVRVRLRRVVVRAGPEDVRLHRRQRIRDRHRRRGAQHPAHQQRPAQRAHRVPGLQQLGHERFCVRRPSFIGGASRVLDLFGTLQEYNKPPTPQLADPPSDV